MKKLFAIFFMIVIHVTTFAYDVCIDGIYYNLKSNDNVAVVTCGDSKYTGSVTIPEVITYNDISYSVEYIGGSAFSCCSELTSVTIPNSITIIYDYAFQGCSSLTSVDIPTSVTTIYGYAFYMCSGLTSVTIPNSVTNIYGYAFSGCSSLTSVDIPNSVTKIYGDTFSNCTGLTSLAIPNSVTCISYEAFEGCTNLKSITIPNSVTSIGVYAFNECPNLAEVIDYAETPQPITSNVFSNAAKATLYVPNSAIDTYNSASGWSNFGTIQALISSISLTDGAPNLTVGSYEVGNVTYTRNTTADKYATFCLPYDIDLGSTDCFKKVYTPMDEVIYNTKTERLCMMFKVKALDATIPAGTPFVGLMNGNEVLLANKEDVTFTGEETNPEPKQLLVFNYSDSGALWQNEDINVKWCGTYTALDAVEGMDAFNADGTFGQLSGKLNPFRAYVMHTAVNGAKVAGVDLNLDEGEATGIDKIENRELKNEDSAVYNLKGQRVNAMQAGQIYVVNGQKFAKH